MGRPQHSQPPPPVEFIQQVFALRPDGRIVRRDHRLTALSHEPPGYRGADGKLMVGVVHQGRTRRISLLRVAWCLAKGEWPKGPVLPKNGDGSDLRADNLVETAPARTVRTPLVAERRHWSGGTRPTQRCSALWPSAPKEAAIIRAAAVSKRKASSKRNVRGLRCSAPIHEPRSPPSPTQTSQTGNRAGNSEMVAHAPASAAAEFTRLNTTEMAAVCRVVAQPSASTSGARKMPPPTPHAGHEPNGSADN